MSRKSSVFGATFVDSVGVVNDAMSDEVNKTWSMKSSDCDLNQYKNNLKLRKHLLDVRMPSEMTNLWQEFC
jgi:hypothetical protein